MLGHTSATPTLRLLATPLHAGSACWVRTHFFLLAPTSTDKKSNARPRLQAKLHKNLPTKFRLSFEPCGTGWESPTTTSFGPRRIATKSGCSNFSAKFATTVTFIKVHTLANIVSSTNYTWTQSDRVRLARNVGDRRKLSRKRIISSNFQPLLTG